VVGVDRYLLKLGAVVVNIHLGGNVELVGYSHDTIPCGRSQVPGDLHLAGIRGLAGAAAAVDQVWEGVSIVSRISSGIGSASCFET